MDAEKLDEKILQELQLELRWMPGVNLRNVAIKATVKAGVAILFGHVSDPSVRRVAEQVARRVLGIRSVVNEIKLHHKASETEQDIGHDHPILDDLGPGQQSPD
jgi:osmotically-inducible protein OsmY